MIKPSHYDDDYVIQWAKSWVPSNSLACLYAIAQDAAAHHVLGPDVAIEINAYDECHTVIPIAKIARRIKAAEGGLVCLVGVQSNQFPRAMAMAEQLRAEGIAVAVGGRRRLPVDAGGITPDIAAARDMGVSLFAGEAEGRLGAIFVDAFNGELKPLYNFMNDLPGLQRQVTPFLPDSTFCAGTATAKAHSMPGEAARSSAAFARSSMCRAANRAGATPTISRLWWAPARRRGFAASSSPTTISRAIAIGKRSSTG